MPHEDKSSSFLAADGSASCASKISPKRTRNILRAVRSTRHLQLLSAASGQETAAGASPQIESPSSEPTAAGVSGQSSQPHVQVPLTPSTECAAEQGIVAAEINPTALGAVALFKSISNAAVGKHVGVSSLVIKEYFSGNPVPLKDTVQQQIAAFLGVDWVNGRMAGDRVHVFHLGAIGLFSQEALFEKRLRTLGSLFDGCKAALVRFPCYAPAKQVLIREVCVLQNNHVRAVFFGANRLVYKASLQPDWMQGCRWVRKTKEQSIANVYQPEIAAQIFGLDLTAIEFDEIFHGKSAIAWRDVVTFARNHRFTKQALIELMRTGDTNQLATAHLPGQSLPEVSICAVEVPPSLEDFHTMDCASWASALASSVRSWRK